MNIINYIKNININLLIIEGLLFMIFLLFLHKKNIHERIKDILIILFSLIIICLFNFFNNPFNMIFKFNYLSIKLYLVVLTIIYGIFLYTINNKKVKFLNKLLNLILFVVTNVFLIMIIYIILTNKFSFLNRIDISKSIRLNNLTIIIFINYITINLIFYIIKLIKPTKITLKKLSFRNLKLKEKIKFKKSRIKNISFKEKITREEKQEELNIEEAINILSNEELLNYDINKELFINGVECSIIFYDSNKENIIKNYHILINDINDSLVNGYTLEENKLLKRICEKLNTNNLFDINLSNINILNKLSVEEYKLLQRINAK